MNVLRLHLGRGVVNLWRFGGEVLYIPAGRQILSPSQRIFDYRNRS